MEDNNEQEMRELVFDLMTEGFKDKVDLENDLYDYLKKETKNSLSALYLLYTYAANKENIEELYKFQKKKKEEMIKSIMEFLDKEFLSILGFFNKERMDCIKKIASYNELIDAGNRDAMNLDFHTILIIKKLDFIFCKREDGNIIIHMPKFIKDKINSIDKDPLYDYYDKLVYYSKGIAETYGAIHIEDAFDLIKDDLPISLERYDSFIKCISILESEEIHYSFLFRCMHCFNITDEDIPEIVLNEKDKILYDTKIYEEIGNGKYLKNLKEYKEFKKYLIYNYDLDLENEDEYILSGRLINDYIEISQVNEQKAMEMLNETINDYFEVDDQERQTLINYVLKITNKMPNWKNGGKIEGYIE